MGSLKRPDLITGIRSKLHNWPIQTALKEAIDDTTNQLRLTDDYARDLAIDGALLEIGSEILRLYTKPDQSDNIKIIRGYMGTTKAPHSAGDRVQVHAPWGWTDYELKLFLNTSVRWLKPAFWAHAVSSEFKTSISELAATVPAGLNLSYPDGNYPYRLEYKDTSQGPTVWLPVDGWKLEGNALRFRLRLQTAYTMRVQYLKFQGILSDDTTTLDDDGAEEPLVFRSAHQALITLAANRTRYLEYAASLNDRASTPDELIRTAYALLNDAVQAKDALSRPLPSGYLTMFREPRS